MSFRSIPELDFWQDLPYTNLIDQEKFNHYYPVNVPNAKSPIVFNINISDDEYLFLSDVYLYLKIQFKIELTPSSDVPDETDWKKLDFANNLLHSLFKAVDFEINNTQVVQTQTTYAYKAFFNNLLNYSQQEKKTILSLVPWINDNESFPDSINENRSHLFRPSTVINKTSKPMVLIGKLALDLFNQHKALIGNTNIKITLVPNEKEFYLRWESGISPELFIQEARIVCRKPKISYEIVNVHNAGLMSEPIPYAIERSEVKSFIIPTSTLTKHVDILTGQIPKYMIIGFVDNSAFAGDKLKSPYNFKDYNLTNICAVIDGSHYPPHGFSPDFSNDNVSIEVLSLYTNIEVPNISENLHITRENYKQGNVLYAFSFSKDKSVPKGGNLSVDVQFKSALSNTINLIAYLVYDNYVMIDGNKEVSKNF